MPAIPGFRDNCYNALLKAQRKYGRPVYTIEIAQEWDALMPYMVTIFLLAGV